MTKNLSLLVAAITLCACSGAAPPRPPEPVAPPSAPVDPTRAGGVVYGKDWAFIVAAPPGWYMSLRSGLPVNAAFFQETPTDAGVPPTFMYVALSKPGPGIETLAKLMAQDEADFRSRSPSLKVTAQPDVLMLDKKPAQVRRFDNTKSGRVELVAYRDFGKGMYKFVATAPSAEALASHVPAFEKMLSTFDTATINFK